MHEFAEEYVANLKPRNERYDTRLGDDFYVATFPNGVKTWSFVFEVNGYTRRQTLGVYPEMPLEQALESLYAARRTRAVESELTEQGLDGTQVRKTEDSPINLTAKLRVPKIKLSGTKRPFLVGALAGVAISLSAALVAWIYLSPTVVMETTARTVSVAVPTPAFASSTTPLNPVNAAADEMPTPELKSVGEKAPAPTEVTVAENPVEPPASRPAVTVAQNPVEPAASRPAVAAAAVAEIPTEPVIEEPAELGKSEMALRKLQQDMTGTLAWAQLTSEVKNGEPVDQLDWVVEVNQAPRRVFYFVRVRGMAGATVTYRWRHEGQLLKEDSVAVGKGWHSPAYSGMTLTAERLGQWQVEVYGPDGKALGSEEFETRLTSDMPQLSLR